MFRSIVLAAALALAGSASYAADTGPYMLDAKGGCHAASGSYAKKEMCSAPKSYTMDAKGGCHDSGGKYAKKEMCKGMKPKG